MTQKIMRSDLLVFFFFFIVKCKTFRVIANAKLFISFQIKNKHGNMPFNLRHFEEETKARMGVVECVSHKMIEPFQVLYEKPSKCQLSMQIVQHSIMQG